MRPEEHCVFVGGLPTARFLACCYSVAPMKTMRLFSLLLLLAAPAAAALPTYSGWPRCLPILAFSDAEIGVASFETFAAPKPVQRWVCMVIDRATLIVTPVDVEDFDARFPGARQAGNHAPNDCREMVRPSRPLVEEAEPPTCISTKVFCDGREIPVKVSAAVLTVRCPGRVFSAATLIDGKLWAGVNPLDSYFRELDGSDLVVQAPASGAVLARRTSNEVGGRSLCAIRQDPLTGNVWATTETGLVEMTGAGQVVRQLRFRATRRPMEIRTRP